MTSAITWPAGLKLALKQQLGHLRNERVPRLCSEATGAPSAADVLTAALPQIQSKLQATIKPAVAEFVVYFLLDLFDQTCCSSHQFLAPSERPLIEKEVQKLKVKRKRDEV